MTSTLDFTALHSDLQANLAALAEKHEVPGVAVGIYAGGAEDYVCHGITSIENPLEVTESTLYQIGSIGKTYTGTVIMILAERGLVDLNAPARTYIPELRLRDESVAERVTVLQLLNHTSGWVGDIMRDTGDGDDALSRYVEELATVDQVNPLGTIASYNNAAVNLAGRVIEKVTGKTFEAAVTDLLLRPLGLTETTFSVQDVLVRRFVVGHEKRDGRLQIARPWGLPRNGNAAGGEIAPVTDVIGYARFHLGHGGDDVLSRESRRRMQEPTFAMGGGHVGISWMLQDALGTRLVSHGGSTNGQQAELLLVPERDFALAMLTNAHAGIQLMSELGNWIIATYLGLTAPQEEPLDLSAEELAPYAGSYDGAVWIATLSVEEDHLRMEIAFTPAGIAEVEAAGMEVPQWQPARVRILPNDHYLILDGEYGGTRGGFVREGDAIVALDLGRVARRISS
jgi:CubicO group peptidase (beta-lactamase class C family)